MVNMSHVEDTWGLLYERHILQVHQDAMQNKPCEGSDYSPRTARKQSTQ